MSLSCEECQGLLFDLREDLLPAEQREVVVGHLLVCERCQVHQQDLELTMQAMPRLEKPSPEARLAIYDLAQRSIRPPWRRISARVELRYALAAMLLVGIGFLLHRQDDPISQVPTAAPDVSASTSLSMPPPEMSDLTLVYVLEETGPLRGHSERWVLEKGGLKHQVGTDPEVIVAGVDSSDTDNLTRLARRLKIIPLPMLTQEPLSCRSGESSELVDLGFEGRKMRARLCDGVAEDPALNEFLQEFKKWLGEKNRLP